jgi:hypothetical protein
MRGRVAVHVTEEALLAAVRMRTGRPVRSASRHVCTCRLMSSRAPNAPPTPPRVRRTCSSGAEAGGDLLAILVQPLGGDEQLDAGAAGVGDRERRLEAEERLVLHADLVGALDHHVAPRWSGRRTRCAGGARRCRSGGSTVRPTDRVTLGVDERVEHLVLDDDRGERTTARLGMVGGDRGHRLADVPHDVAREHRLVLVDEAVGGLPGTSSAVMTASTPSDRPRTRHVDRTRCARTGAASAAWHPTGSRRPPRSLENANVPCTFATPSGRAPLSPSTASPRAGVDLGHAHAAPRPSRRATATALHGVDDAAVAGAAAHVARQLLADLHLARLGLRSSRRAWP